MAAFANAAQPIQIVLDGELLVFDVPPTNIDDRVMVPMRVIFEALGAEVDWDEEAETITATKGNVIIVSVVGEYTISVSGTEVLMDVAPLIVGDRALVPARFVSEALGAEVYWHAGRGTVYITSANVTPVSNEQASYGVWSIRYDANGGERTPQSHGWAINRLGAYFVIPMAEPVRNGYTFIGWSFTRDGDGGLFRPGEYIQRATASHMTFFAQWSRSEPIEPRAPQRGRLTVRYDANGGPGAPTSHTHTISEYGEVSFNLSRVQLTRDGYTFLGWLLEDIHGFGVEEPGQRVLMLDLDPYRNLTITYFAQWQRD